MKTKYILIVLLFVVTNVRSQDLIDVVETTFKVGGMGDEELYFGFAEGDQVIFNFEEAKGKKLKEIEIIEYPNTVRFSDFNSKKIANKSITISKTGIFKFRFKNSTAVGRICKLKIQRVPASEETKRFNTTVVWKDVMDTTYYSVNERYLARVDTTIENVIDQVSKVHSQTNINGAKTTLNFKLPPNTKKWSYYIGVDQSGQQAYEDAVNSISQSASSLVARIPGYGPMVALALGGTSYLTLAQRGEDIDYYLVHNENVNLFLSGQQFSYLKKGKVINDFSQMNEVNNVNYHFCLSNDNAITGVTVMVKVTAIVITEEWETRTIEKMRISSTKEPLLLN